MAAKLIFSLLQPCWCCVVRPLAIFGGMEEWKSLLTRSFIFSSFSCLKGRGLVWSFRVPWQLMAWERPLQTAIHPAKAVSEEWPFARFHLSQREPYCSLALALHFQTIIPNPSQNTYIGDRFFSLPGFFSALKTPEEAQEAPEAPEISKFTRKQNKTPFLTQMSYKRLA